VFPPEVRLVRGYLIDYLSKEHFSLEQTYKVIMVVINSRQLTLREVLKIIGHLEEDPLCVPYVSKVKKTEKLKRLRKLLSSLTNMEKG
jgi:hypothetical protein